MKPLIIGVDPGSTSAVAMIDFKGEVVELQSGKNFPPREIIQEIIENGKPVIVASDKEKTPSNVEKIANSLGAEKFEPEEDLRQERKRELGEGENSHEKDAVASARHAFKQLRPKIRKIEKLSEQRDEEKSDVAEKYFSGELGGPEEDGEEENTEREEGRAQEETSPSKEEQEINGKKWKRKAEKLEGKAENLEEQVEDLKEKLEFREEQRRNLQSKYDKLKAEKKDEMLKEQEISKREGKLKEKEDEISELEKKLERSRIREKQYEKALDLIAEGGEILPVIDDETGEVPEKALTRSEELRDELVAEGEKVYYIEEVEGVELLERFIVEELPDQNVKEIIERYRDAR
jgi:predicted RNase H-like nuclease (RuvC/YqgF family)